MLVKVSIDTAADVALRPSHRKKRREEKVFVMALYDSYFMHTGGSNGIQVSECVHKEYTCANYYIAIKQLLISQLESCLISNTLAVERN